MCGTWTRMRSGDSWLLHLDRIDLGTRKLEDVVILLGEDNRAGEHAAAYLRTWMQGQALSPTESYALAQAILEIAQNGK